MNFPHPDAHILPDKIKFTLPPPSSKPKEFERVLGSLVGLATGDALGASVEFRPRQYLVDSPVQEMQSGGTWGLEAGQWTDDTSMALCLASSLINCRAYNPYDQMVRYKWWFKKGFLSSTGTCFDIGSTTRASLEEFSDRQKTLKQHFRNAKDEEIDHLTLEQIRKVQGFNEYCGKPGQAGNGPLMRLAPIPLFYFRRPDQAVAYAGDSALLTHGDKKAADACRYYAALTVAAIHGESKEELLSSGFYEKHRPWFGPEKLHDEVWRVAQGSFKKPRGYDDGIRGKNYIVNTLEAALWAFWSDGNQFETGARNAVNLGDDTDTTAAVYGQLAGAYYCIGGIPRRWAEKLYARDFLLGVGEWLYFQGDQSACGRNQQQQQQQQQRITAQQYNPTTTATSQPSQQQATVHRSNQQTGPTIQKDRVGYGPPGPSKLSTQTKPQPSYQTGSNKNYSEPKDRREKSKLDPSKLPAAGVPSGFQSS